MPIKSVLSIIAFVLGAVALPAQEKEKPVPVRIRAVLHDPLNPVANLFYMDQNGAVVPLLLRPQAFNEAILALPLDGALVFFDKADIDPENPMASMAASARLAPDTKQAMVVVLPSPQGQKPAYRLMLVDDSEKAFPWGESRVLALVSVKTAIEAGEHKVVVPPGKLTRIPPVRKVNDFNMAQTNFYYQHGESSVAFAERQLQYLDACRRLFIIHATPGALQPTVTTIVDTAPIRAHLAP
jgi:hypothetical protein